MKFVIAAVIVIMFLLGCKDGSKVKPITPPSIVLKTTTKEYRYNDPKFFFVACGNELIVLGIQCKDEIDGVEVKKEEFVSLKGKGYFRCSFPTETIWYSGHVLIESSSIILDTYYLKNWTDILVVKEAL